MAKIRGTLEAQLCSVHPNGRAIKNGVSFEQKINEKAKDPAFAPQQP
jgi:hypothetical protein